MAPTQQTEPNPEKSNSQLHPASSHTNLNGDRRNITSTVRQPRQQSHSRRVGQPQGSVGVNGPTSAQQLPQSGNIHNFNRPSTSSSHPTPLFERLVTEEVQELKAYARIIENQNRRLADLERIHADLESRLQVESRGKMQLETTLEQREREWAARFHQLQSDRDRWKCEVDKEKEKNAKLYDQVVRKDQDIQRMLQRKVRYSIVFFGSSKATYSRLMTSLIIHFMFDSMTTNESRPKDSPSEGIACSTRPASDRERLPGRRRPRELELSSLIKVLMRSLKLVALWIPSE